MKLHKILTACAAVIFTFFALCSQNVKSWEGIHQATLPEVQKNFVNPPADFANHVIWGWEGAMDIKTIRADLDSMYSKGFRSVIFEAGYNLPFEYLSDGWFKTVATAVKEAKKRGMKVWIIDEGKYPSGFAGGKFSRERPDLRMQALVVCDTVRVEAGRTLTNFAVDTFAISAVAVNRSQPDRIVEIKNHRISFNAGIHDWNILLVRPDFRTAQTRAVNDPTRGKTTANSICDYLNPAAVRQFIDWTHEQYKKYLGKELGTTVLGFRGDEPDYAHTPFTPAIIEVFKQKKGYDPVPYLATLLSGHTGDFNFRVTAPVPYPSAQFAQMRSEEEKRFKADYWDIFSEMFADNFFGQQAQWCKQNGVAHITHLNNEHNMPVCIRAEGDFFRDLSKVQIPGVDAIWNQIWHGTVNNFPKLASSVAHVYGKPRSFSESFAAYDISPTIPEAKYVVDYQIVRGINFFELMFWSAGSRRRTWMSAPEMSNLNAHANRSVYLMSLGAPGARIAVYYPTSTMWLGNNEVFTHITDISEKLLAHQRDFDYINDDAFLDKITVNQGYLKNASGQKYYTLIIPSADAVSVDAWKKIAEFAERGGKLLFWGKKPDMLVAQTFTKPQNFPADFSKYLQETSATWTPTVEAAMPEAEMSIQQPLRRRSIRSAQTADNQQIAKTNFIRYTRRVLPDADIYFIMNEGDSVCSFTAEFDKIGIVQEYNTVNGKIGDIDFTAQNGKTVVKFEMQAWESRIISIKKSKKEYSITDFGALSDGKTVNTAAIQRAIDAANAAGGGCVVIPKGEFLSGALFFKDGVDLNIKKDAVLVSTVSAEDFPVISTRFEGIERNWRCAFLNFDNSKNVRVFGEGTIDGKGVEWKTIPFGGGGRPRLICFTACDGGSISGLKLRDQASWCVHVLYTDGFGIEDLDIRAEHTIPSSDGLDIDSSNDIVVKRVYIDVNDDCISIKSGKDTDGRRVARPSENILIDDCHFAYGHGGVALGSEISGCIRNVVIQNCLIDGDNWGPVRFKSQPSRGGIVENIVFDNIKVENARMLLDINMEWRMVGQLEAAAEPLTRLRNIKISNVTAKARTVGTMYGYAAAPFGNDVFHFENCSVTAATGLSMANADAVNLNGLNITVEKGEKTFKRQ